MSNNIRNNLNNTNMNALCMPVYSSQQASNVPSYAYSGYSSFYSATNQPDPAFSLDNFPLIVNNRNPFASPTRTASSPNLDEFDPMNLKLTQSYSASNEMADFGMTVMQAVSVPDSSDACSDFDTATSRSMSFFDPLSKKNVTVGCNAAATGDERNECVRKSYVTPCHCSAAEPSVKCEKCANRERDLLNRRREGKSLAATEIEVGEIAAGEMRVIPMMQKSLRGKNSPYSNDYRIEAESIQPPGAAAADEAGCFQGRLIKKTLYTPAKSGPCNTYVPVKSDVYKDKHAPPSTLYLETDENLTGSPMSVISRLPVNAKDQELVSELPENEHPALTKRHLREDLSKLQSAVGKLKCDILRYKAKQDQNGTDTDTAASSSESQSNYKKVDAGMDSMWAAPIPMREISRLPWMDMVARKKWTGRTASWKQRLRGKIFPWGYAHAILNKAGLRWGSRRALQPKMVNHVPSQGSRKPAAEKSDDDELSFDEMLMEIPNVDNHSDLDAVEVKMTRRHYDPFLGSTVNTVKTAAKTTWHSRSKIALVSPNGSGAETHHREVGKSSSSNSAGKSPSGKEKPGKKSGITHIQQLFNEMQQSYQKQLILLEKSRLNAEGEDDWLADWYDKPPAEGDRGMMEKSKEQSSSKVDVSSGELMPSAKKERDALAAAVAIVECSVPLVDLDDCPQQMQQQQQPHCGANLIDFETAACDRVTIKTQAEQPKAILPPPTTH